MDRLQREITPIGEEDLFIVMNYHNAKFDYACHFHSEFEINLAAILKKHCKGNMLYTI